MDLLTLVLILTSTSAPPQADPFTLGPRVDLSGLELPQPPEPSVLPISLGVFVGPSLGGTDLVHANVRSGVGLDDWWLGLFVSSGLGEGALPVEGLGDVLVLPVALMGGAEFCPLDWLCAELGAGPEWLVGRSTGNLLFRQATVVELELRIDARLRLRYALERLSLHLSTGVQARPLGAGFEVEGVGRFGPEPWAATVELGVDLWLTRKKDRGR